MCNGLVPKHMYICTINFIWGKKKKNEDVTNPYVAWTKEYWSGIMKQSPQAEENIGTIIISLFPKIVVSENPSVYSSL